MSATATGSKAGLGMRANRVAGGASVRVGRTGEAGLVPRCDGRVWKPRVRGDWHARVREEFCGIYHQLNRIGARIQKLRSDDSPSARVLWRVLERALRRRDALEDRWIPRGVVAEPVLAGGLVVDVVFTFPDVDARGQPRLGLAGSSSAAVIVVEQEDVC